ncbi:MAG: hypothetical protein B6245_22290 [Desulfobacteraceae bacterium 4572_88]|nr:MAG: hypothetical protein B6245_22290 [Desulfobacteraceae bacterium 4572_88]
MKEKHTMFKKMKLRTKIFGGFAIVLLLLLFVACSEFFVLHEAGSRRNKSEAMNQLMHYIMEARRQEKNFLLRRDPMYLQKNAAIVETAKKLAVESKPRFRHQTNKDRMDKIVAEFGDYEKAFKSYVELESQGDTLMRQVIEKARLSVDRIRDIHEVQKNQAEALRKQKEKAIEEKVAKADKTVHLVRLLSKAKLIGLSLQMNRYDETLLAEWQSVSQQILDLAEEMKTSLRLEEHIQQADQVLVSYKEYMTGLSGYLEFQTEDGLETLEGAVRIAGEAAEQLWKMQKAHARKTSTEHASAENSESSDTNAASLLTELSWEVRKKMRDMLLSRSGKHTDSLLKQTGHLLTLTRDLKKQLRTDNSIKACDGAIAALQAYETAARSYAEAMRQQQKQDDIMVREAREVHKICEETSAYQKAEMTEHIGKAKKITLIITILAILVGVLSALGITRNITRSLNTVIEGLAGSAGEVTAAAEQVASASHSLAGGASEQAASVEESASSMEEMAAMTRQNASNAKQADTLMRQTRQVVQKVSRSMNELTDSMESVSKASEETFKIIKNIDEIAFQTNLLALNAAVEAARAGEAGAGFAVVAEEVRSLAMRTTEAAKSTSSLIEGTVKRIRDGAEIVTKTNEAFSEVAVSSEKVGGLVGEIAAASHEQSQGIEQVNSASSEMDNVTQQNASDAEEISSISEEMDAQAIQMKEFVDTLILLLGCKISRGGETTCGFIAGLKQDKKESAPMLPEKPIQRQSEEVRPDHLIPLDDDDFADF